MADRISAYYVSRVLGVVIVVIVGLILWVVLPSGVKLDAKVQSVDSSGASQVTVAWEIKNEGGNSAFFRHCTLSVSNRGGSIVGTTAGGPYPPQSTFGPVSPGAVWRARTPISTEGSSLDAIRGEVTCTNAVNASSGGK